MSDHPIEVTYRGVAVPVYFWFDVASASTPSDNLAAWCDGVDAATPMDEPDALVLEERLRRAVDLLRDELMKARGELASATMSRDLSQSLVDRLRVKLSDAERDRDDARAACKELCAELRAERAGRRMTTGGSLA